MARVRWLAVVMVAISACAGEDQPPASSTAITPVATSLTTPSTALSTTPSTALAIESTIGIGGGQALGLTASEDRVWVVSYDTGALVSIDPTTNAVDTTVDIGVGAATAITIDGEVWVVSYDGPDDLHHVDSSGAVAGAYAIGDLCCDPSADGNLWVLSATGFAYEIDPASGEVLAQFPIDVDADVHVNGVFADGAYWFSSDTTALARLDPATRDIVEYDVGGGVPFFARDGLLWGASVDEVWAVDTSTGDVVERVRVPDSIEVISLEVAGDSVFVGMRHPGYVGGVLRLDRASGELLDEIAVDIPARMVLAFGSLWVTDSGSDAVVRIGPINSA